MKEPLTSGKGRQQILCVSASVQLPFNQAFNWAEIARSLLYSFIVYASRVTGRSNQSLSSWASQSNSISVSNPSPPEN